MPSQSLRFLLVSVCVLSSFSKPYAHAEDRWTEIRSPHFRVLVEGSASQGRTVANDFEQMRHVFALRFGDDKIDPGVPLTIFATDEGTFRELDPRLWKESRGRVAGFFDQGWEKAFAAIRLDLGSEQGRTTVFHEYTHSILHANSVRLPLWLDEGLAEFYGYTKIEPERIVIGMPSPRMGAIRGRTAIPVASMLSTLDYSKFLGDDRDAQMFYGESWALVHYMMFGPGMENGLKLERFFKLLQTKEPQDKAFQEAFGDPKAFDNSFDQYMSSLALRASVLPSDKGVDQKTFTEHRLTGAEVAYELGSFHVADHDRATGRTLIEKAIALDPKLAGPHEELGYLEFEAGNDEAAKKEWQAALALDPDRARSLFAVTMMGVPFSRQSADELRETRKTLRHVTELAPRYAAAYAELAILEWQIGAMLPAYKDALQAQNLAPSRMGYRVLAGYILLRGKQPEMAADDARYVVVHGTGPDHNEGIDLWNAVPVDKRGDGPPTIYSVPSGAEIARGTLLDVTCGSKAEDKGMSVTFMPDNPGAKAMTFKDVKHARIGFSDTLWWGEDHFVACRHTSGLPAVIGYKTGGSGDGDLVDLEIRDSLPLKK